MIILGKPSEQKITPGILPTLRGAKWWGKLDAIFFSYCQEFTHILKTATIKRKEKRFINEIHSLEDIKCIDLSTNCIALETNLEDIDASQYDQIFTENRFPNVTLLSINTAASNELLIALTRACSNIETFNVEDDFEGPKELSPDVLLKVLANCKNLKEVYVEWNLKLPNSLAVKMSKLCPKLEYLHLRYSKMSHLFACHLLRNAPNLQVIYLYSGGNKPVLFARHSATLTKIASFFQIVDWNKSPRLFDQFFIY